MDFFTVISTSSFQDAPPPAISGPKVGASLSGPDSFGQQLSAHLTQQRDMSERSSIASTRPAPAQSRRPDAPEQPESRPRPRAEPPRPTHTAAAQDRPDHSQQPEKADSKKAGAHPAATKAPPKDTGQKAVKASATTENTANTKTDKSPQPQDGNLDATAELKSPFAQAGNLLSDAVSKQKTAKTDAAAKSDKAKSDDKSKGDGSLVNGLPAGALAIALPAAVQTPEQSAPSTQGDAAAQPKSPLGILPGTVGELVSEAAKLMKDAKAAKATGSDTPAPQGKEAKADAPKAPPLPAPFAALVKAIKDGTLKLQPATSQDGAPTLKPTAGDATVAAKVDGGTAPKAQAAATANNGTSLSAMLTDGKADISAVNGQPASGTPSPATPLATAVAAKDAPVAAPAPQAAKVDVSLNPLPFATLSAVGQGPLQVNQSPVAAPGNNMLAAGPAYAAAHVAVQITKTVSDGGNQFSIRLDPAELGRVDVKLHFGHDGHVTAAVSADHQHTLDLLRRDAGMLNQALQDSGLKTDQGSLNFSLRQQWQQQQNQQDFSTGQQGGRNSAMPEAVSEPVVAASSVRQFISNRALDISV